MDKQQPLSNINSHKIQLGKKYASNDEAEIAQRNLIWFSYRSQFSKLCSTEFSSDSGWGCMLRSGQMAFANGLALHLQETSGKTQDKLREDVIQLFRDTPDALLSIHNIANLAMKEFSLPPGEWYSPNRIAFCLSKLFNSSEFAGQVSLTSEVMYSDRPLAFASCFVSMTGQQFDNSLEKNVLGDETIPTQKSLLLFIICQIGIDKPEDNYLKILLQLFTHPSSIGMIGGTGSLGYYFTGMVANKLTFLDPHCVQVHDSDLKHNDLHSYQPKLLQCIRKEAMGPSVGLGFYLKDVKALNELWQFMLSLQQNDPDSFFLTIQKEEELFEDDRNIVEDEDYCILE